jgi:hypothetical protein
MMNEQGETARVEGTVLYLDRSSLQSSSVSGSRCGSVIGLQSDVPAGDSVRSGTTIVWHSSFRVPERDCERHGFVAGDLVLLRGCVISGAGV